MANKHKKAAPRTEVHGSLYKIRNINLTNCTVNIGADGSVNTLRNDVNLDAKSQTLQMAEAPATDGFGNVVEQLIPIFNHQKAVAHEFLQTAQHASPTQITALVNRLCSQGLVDLNQRKKSLWNILHQEGLYLPSLQNWNRQIR